MTYYNDLKNMNILIDLQPCQSGSAKGGIGRYSLELTKAILQENRHHKISILLNATLPYENEIRSQLKNLIPSHHFHVFNIPNHIAELYDLPFKTRVAELIRERFIADLNPDVVYISSLFEGLGDNVVSSIGSLYPKERTVVTLYDLIPLATPKNYLTNHILKGHYLRKVEHLKKAELLLAISEYSMEEGIKLLPASPKRVTNISSAADEKFRKLNLTNEDLTAIKEKYRINNRFLMFTGSYDSRKNHSTLIKAFALLNKKLQSEYQLVFVGHGSESTYKRLMNSGKKLGLEDTSLIFLDGINDEELVKLYNACTLFVFPSLREGFGLPALEAMACGCPTIGSNTTCIPEVIQIDEAMFNPQSADEIADRMTFFLENDSARNKLAENQAKNAKKFSWRETAKKALAFIENNISQAPNNVLSNGYTNFLSVYKQLKKEYSEDVDTGFLSACATSLMKNELAINSINRQLKVGWVSTWNTKCGIASYSKYLLEHFTSEIYIFANQSNDLTHDDQTNVSRCWTMESNNLDPLKNEILAQNIDIVMIQFNYGFFDFHSLTELITQLKQSGLGIFLTFHSTKDPDERILKKKLSSLTNTINNADGVFVHSLNDIKRLENIGITTEVRLLNQGFHNYETLPTSYKMTSSIASYGYFLPHKGLDIIVDAIKILHDKGKKVNLQMINAAYPAQISYNLIEDIKEKIKNYNLENHITLITDYLEDDESIEKLHESEIIIYAYQNTGESSSAAVRMGIASKKLVLVTPLDIFHDVSDCVIKMHGFDAHTIADEIEDYLNKLIHHSHETSNVINHAMRMVDMNSWQNVATFLEKQLHYLYETN